MMKNRALGGGRGWRLRDSGVGRFHALRDIAVAVVHLVDLLEAIERGGLVAHFLVDEALFVEDFLFDVVHGVEVGEGVRELFDGKVEHALGLEGAA